MTSGSIKIDNRKISLYARRFFSVLFIAILMPMTLAKTPPNTDQAVAEQSASQPKPFEYRVQKKGTFFGETMEYEVVVRDHWVRDEEQKPIASLSSLFYRKLDEDEPEKRPIVYVFNGGPGSSSVWLHMGLLGPKRVIVPSDATLAGAPPYPIENNALSLLAVADLVFIDPVGTGYSRVLGTQEEKENNREQFFGVDEDAESISNFIQEHLTRYGRWASPKFLIGESYGTTRSGLLVEKLQGSLQSVFLNGVVLISAVLDFSLNDFYSSNELAYMAFLPTYVATAHYHKRLQDKQASLDTLLKDTKAFIFDTYLSALVKGNRLSHAENKAIAERLQVLTGLPLDAIKRAENRIRDDYFRKLLLRETSQVVGRFDSRYLGQDQNDVENSPDGDPSDYGISSAYTAAQNHYLFHTLGIKRDETYRIFTDEAWEHWNWVSAQERWYQASPIDVTQKLDRGMRENPNLQLFVANGYYDLATPFFATELALTRYRMDPDRIKMHYFEAGHMMYTHQPSFERLAKALKAFVLDASVKPKIQGSK